MQIVKLEDLEKLSAAEWRKQERDFAFFKYVFTALALLGSGVSIFLCWALSVPPAYDGRSEWWPIPLAMLFTVCFAVLSFLLDAEARWAGWQADKAEIEEKGNP